MKADKSKIHGIINNQQILEIPFFQRSYVWTEENLQRFLDDMVAVSNEEHEEYFLGSVILKEQDTESDEDIKTIIDGQQRITTLAIFFKCLYSIHDEKEKGKFDGIFKLNDNDEIVIRHNHFDKKPFEAVLNDEMTKEIKKEYSGSKIIECYNFFHKKENIEILKNINIKKIWKKVHFVEITLTKDEDEQQIFDTINSLGVSLTTAELLKNYLFDRNDEQLYNDTWKKKFEIEDREYWSQKIIAGRAPRANIDLLLEAFLTILKIKSESDSKYVKLSSIFNNYKDYIKKEKDRKGFDKIKFINELIEAAKRYKKNIEPALIEETITKQIERINLIIFGLQTTTVIPYILYLTESVQDTDEREKMIALIENYFIRRVICREINKSYGNLFASFIQKEINSYEKLKKEILSGEGSRLQDKFPIDKDFKESIINEKIANPPARIFLYLLENSLQNKNSEKNVMQLKSLKSYNVEHVMPKKWKNKWPATKNQEKRNELIYTLGNLTLITGRLNREISDNSWKVKKEGQGKKGGLISHAKGLNIFDDYLESGKEWDEDTIERRSKFLAEKALEVWPHPND